MTEQPPHVELRPDTGSGSPPGMPRWVKMAAITVGILILLFVILRLTGIGGEHGPGRHMSGSVPQSTSLEDWTSVAGTVA